MPNRFTLRVLIVDPYPDIAESQALLVVHWGYQARTARDAATALLRFHQWNPHVVLVEPELPGFQGLPFIRALRLRKSTEELSIIAISGLITVMAVQAAHTAGIDHFFSKPVDPGKVLTLLTESQERLFTGVKGRRQLIGQELCVQG